MRSPKTIASFGLALLLVAAGCTKTAEEEKARWTEAKANTEELTVLYPAFEPALVAQQAEAEKAMKAARAVSDAEQRAEKMSEANDMLTQGFVGQLRKVDRSTKRIRRKAMELSRGAIHGDIRMNARAASDTTERVLAEVKARLDEGAEDPAAAKVIMAKVTSDLRAAESNLDRLRRAMRSAEGEVAKKVGSALKKAAKAKKKKKAREAAGAATESPEPAVATWTCEYCGSSNHANVLSCASCGAPKASGGSKARKDDSSRKKRKSRSRSKRRSRRKKRRR